MLDMTADGSEERWGLGGGERKEGEGEEEEEAVIREEEVAQEIRKTVKKMRIGGASGREVSLDAL